MSACREVIVRAGAGWLVAVLACLPACMAPPAEKSALPTTVPVVLDHNRMLVEAEILRRAGGWRRTRLWVDTGAPDFYMSETLARDLGIDLPKEGERPESGRFEIPPPPDVRVGGVSLSFEGVASSVLFEPAWLFGSRPFEANLPATVLMR